MFFVHSQCITNTRIVQFRQKQINYLTSNRRRKALINYFRVQPVRRKNVFNTYNWDKIRNREKGPDKLPPLVEKFRKPFGLCKCDARSCAQANNKFINVAVEILKY